MLLIASVLCVVVLGWFSLRLKRDLDFMRRRLSKGKPWYFLTQRSSDLFSKCEFIRSARNFENHSLNFSLLHFNILLYRKFDCNCVVP